MVKGSTLRLQNQYYCKQCKKKFKRYANDLRPSLCDACLEKQHDETKEYLDKLKITIEDHFNKKESNGK